MAEKLKVPVYRYSRDCAVKEENTCHILGSVLLVLILKGIYNVKSI